MGGVPSGTPANISATPRRAAATSRRCRVQGGLLGEQRRGILVDVGHDFSACLCRLAGAQFTK